MRGWVVFHGRSSLYLLRSVPRNEANPLHFGAASLPPLNFDALLDGILTMVPDRLLRRISITPKPHSDDFLDRTRVRPGP